MNSERFCPVIDCYATTNLMFQKVHKVVLKLIHMNLMMGKKMI